MARMGLEAIYKRPRTNQPHPHHPVYPYLLRTKVIDRSNQGWCTDITFVPVRTRHLYLVAIMDWATRKVLSWRLSNTMHADCCVDALNEAIAKHGPPEIMNTDQESYFTGSAWMTELTAAGMRISIDGLGRYLDNIFIEQLWRSLKQEAINSKKSPTGFRPDAPSRTGWHSTTLSDPIPRLIGSHPTTHIGRAWKSKKQDET